MRIRSLMLVTAAVIALAVPGLAPAADAAAMSGSSLSAARSVSSVGAQGAAVGKVSDGSGWQAILADPEKAVSVRVPCGDGDCGFNGNVQWGSSFLKIWGIVWGTKDSGAEVLVTWDSGGASFLRGAGSAPGAVGVGVNKYYKTSPSYIQVQVCGRPGDCSAPEDP